MVFYECVVTAKNTARTSLLLWWTVRQYPIPSQLTSFGRLSRADGLDEAIVA